MKDNQWSNHVALFTCSALPKEKDSAQGFVCPASRFSSFRLMVASSSDCPPDRNMMPGIAGGTHLQGAGSMQ